MRRKTDEMTEAEAEKSLPRFVRPTSTSAFNPARPMRYVIGPIPRPLARRLASHHIIPVAPTTANALNTHARP